MPPTPAGDIAIGAYVEVGAGRGYVRFAGATQFAPGKWVGVELDKPNGKNDGSVAGVHYFDCTPLHGVFVRPSQAKVVARPPANNIRTPEPPTPSRPSPVPGLGRSTSTRSSGPPSSIGTSRAASPAKASPASHSPIPVSNNYAPSVPTRMGPPPRPQLQQSTSASSSSGLPRAGANPALSASTTILPSQTRLPPPGRRHSIRNSVDLSSLPVPLPRSPSSSIATPPHPQNTPPSPSHLQSSYLPAPSSPSPASGSGLPTPSRLPPLSMPKPVSRVASMGIPPSHLQATPREDPEGLKASTSSPINIIPSPRIDVNVNSSTAAVSGTNGMLGVPTSLSPTSSTLPQLTPSSASTSDDSSELRIKLRVLETKRAADAQLIRDLEGRLTASEAFLAFKPKLQLKLQSLQSECAGYKREIADLKVEQKGLETKLEEMSEQVEMSMLDREVAEEGKEAAEHELEVERERRAELEVELGVLKGGAGGKTGTSGATDGTVREGEDGEGEGEGGEKSLDYIQLEKQNERLKEALIRLRDITHEADADHRRKMAELEHELAATDEMQSQFEQTLSRLENAENQIDDLKQQLDDALGAEDMVVQLTERTLEMGERIEEMKAEIEDLEALKELSDEMEEHHMETEKVLQEEIDEKDMQLHNHVRAIEAMQDAIEDYNSTIEQFRDLVAILQADLEAAREQSQSHKQESQNQATQAAAALALNMKLQSTTTKNQTKTIDLEIKRLDAAQARELLSIVTPYLPQAYIEHDKDAASVYMLFQRLSYKLDLINTMVAQSYGLPETLYADISDSGLVGVCEMRGMASHVSTLCKRFASILRKCDGEFYISMGNLLPEIAPMERRLDMHIDTLRREEFRFLECGSDVQKMLGQFEHLAEKYFSGFTFDLGERQLDRILSVEHDLDSFVAAIGLSKFELESAMRDEEIVVEQEDLDIQSLLLVPMVGVLEATRSAKAAARKISKRVDDLLHESAALRDDAIPQLVLLADAVTKAVDFGIQFGQRIGKYITDVRTSKSPFQISVVLSAAREISSAVIPSKAKDLSSWAAVKDVIQTLTRDAVAFLPAAMEADHVVKIMGEAPWTVRVAEIKAKAAVNLDAEHKVTQLNEELQNMMRAIRIRDERLQESTIKIDLMERRSETVKKHADTITELEAELAKSQKQENAYSEAIDQMQREVDELQEECAKLKAAASNAPDRPVATVLPTEGPEALHHEGNLETSYLLEQIDGLRGAVRFLRTENSYLKGQDLIRELQLLPPLPDLVESADDASTDSDESDTDDIDFLKSSAPIAPLKSIRALDTASKVLYRDLLTFSSTPRVVDLSAYNPKSKAITDVSSKPGKSTRGWLPQKKHPQHQLWERSVEAGKLHERLAGLSERTALIAQSRNSLMKLRPVVSKVA